MYLCVNEQCHARWTQEQLCEIDMSNPFVVEWMSTWVGSKPPQHGCKDCGWPLVKLKHVIKDLIAAKTDGEIGIQRAVSRTSPEWRAAGLSIVYNVALKKDQLTTTDLYPEVLEIEYLNKGKPFSMRAVAGLMKAAQSQGWIECTELIAQSEIVGHNGASLMMWRSLIRLRGGPFKVEWLDQNGDGSDDYFDDLQTALDFMDLIRPRCVMADLYEKFKDDWRHV